jgi:CubicO group peptidase (beta-lactamase class C family)
MGKALTSIAAMQLVEQGRLSLDGPIREYLPHLAAPMVLDHFRPDGTVALRPAAGPITLRHLLTHSAGYSYEFWNADYTRLCTSLGLAPWPSSHEEIARLPLLFDPGTRFNYGINADIVGHAVEAITGRGLADYLRHHVTDPLGMADTTFALDAGQKARVAGMHQRQTDGKLVPVDRPPLDGPGFLAGGGGQFGTASDYIRLLRMLLNGGALNGVRLLREDTVAEMGRNQLGTVSVMPMRSAMPDWTFDADLFPGIEKKWTLAFLTNTTAGPNGRSSGSLTWAGIYNTYFWLDPNRGVAGVVLTQSLPFADPTALALLGSLERGVYAR